MNMCLNLNLLPHELIVDNFAGGGGTSTGLEKAFGRPVDIAINHDPKAIAMHRANHPNTRHFCEDVWDVDPVKVTNNQPVGLVWLSPDCKHFSKAKGGKPVEKKIRGLAWIALRWADLTRPRIIMLENVEEFKTWGRLGKDGFPSKTLISAAEAAKISESAQPSTLEELKQEVGVFITSLAAKGQKEMTFTLSKSRATMAVVNELQQSLIDLGYQIELDVLDHNNYFLKIKF